MAKGPKAMEKAMGPHEWYWQGRSRELRGSVPSWNCPRRLDGTGGIKLNFRIGKENEKIRENTPGAGRGEKQWQKSKSTRWAGGECEGHEAGRWRRVRAASLGPPQGNARLRLWTWPSRLLLQSPGTQSCPWQDNDGHWAEKPWFIPGSGPSSSI